MNIKALTSLIFFINNIAGLTLSSVLANFGSLNIATLGRLTIGASAIQADNLCIIGSTTLTQKLYCSAGDAAIYLTSGSSGKAGWICNNTGQVTFRASVNTTPQIMRFQASSLITNLTMNTNGSSSFGTNAITTGAIVASGDLSTTTNITSPLATITTLNCTNLNATGDLKL